MKTDKKSHPLEQLPSNAEIISQAHIFPLPGKQKKKYPLKLILRLISVTVIPILALATFAIYNALVRYPGQDKLHLVEQAQQVSNVHTDENVLNVHYETVHWVNDPTADVLDYYQQYGLSTVREAQERYHLIYLTVPDDGQALEPTAQDEIRGLQDCRLEASLQKIENCYFVILVDLSEPVGFLELQGLPKWLSSAMLPNQHEGTIIYHQWWTAKAY